MVSACLLRGGPPHAGSLVGTTIGNDPGFPHRRRLPVIASDAPSRPPLANVVPAGNLYLIQPVPVTDRPAQEQPMSGRNRSGRDAMGAGLSALNKLAGTGLLDRFKARKPAERAVFEASKAGFRAVATANRTFAKAKGGAKPERLAGSGSTGLFDLTPTDEQKMIVEATARVRGRATASRGGRGRHRLRRPRHGAQALGHRARDHPARRARVARRHEHRARDHDRRARRRGARPRRHGPRGRLPGAGRRGQRARALGRRRSAGDLPARRSSARTCPPPP